MKVSGFIDKLQQTPTIISFDECMSIIDANFIFSETAFKNAEIHNEAGQNNASCKILAFAELNELSELHTLNCFGDYYRKDVLENPHGNDHQNIRNFMQLGWKGISFQGKALTLK
jgi:hypothetical protein